MRLNLWLVFTVPLQISGDVVGGRYEQERTKAQEIAFSEMENKAKLLGADGVVGIDIDYEVVGPKGDMMMVSVSGTAVKFKD